MTDSKKTAGERTKQTTRDHLNTMVQRCKDFDTGARYIPPQRDFFTSRVLKEKIGAKSREPLNLDLTQAVAEKYALDINRPPADQPGSPLLNSPSSMADPLRLANSHRPSPMNSSLSLSLLFTSSS